MLEISLFLILFFVFVLPVIIPKVEKNLELFLFIMGLSAVLCSHYFGSRQVLSFHLIYESFVEPLMITAAVIVMGFLLHFYRDKITAYIVEVEHAAGSKWFCFILVAALGFISSIITAIMASIILVEVVSALKLNKKYEIKLVILGCFSIGLGAVLTPIGEPLSTIAISKLKGEPYYADFFFLLKTLGVYVIPGVISLGIIGAIIQPSIKEKSNESTLSQKQKSSIKDIFLYAGRVYIFIMALVYLGTGFKPIVDKYIINLPNSLLYWINTVSAVLDNATLTAAEISPKMSLPQIKYILMGLLISGGMLIPGNVPNIIAAGRLNIKSKEWAKFAVPFGFIIMIVYFIVFLLIY